MIMVREPGDPAPNTVEYRHGLTPPMKDARKRRFRREPDLNVICICYRQSSPGLINIWDSEPENKRMRIFGLSSFESCD